MLLQISIFIVFFFFLDFKRVAWPPPPEDQDFDYVEQGPVQAKVRR